MHEPRTTSLRTRDPQAAHALVSQAYADNHLRVSGSASDFRFSQTRHDLGAVRLDDFHNTMTTEYTMDPLRCLVVCRMLDRTMDIKIGGDEKRVGPGEVVLIAPPDQPYRTRVHGARLQLIGVDLSLVGDLMDPDEITDRLRRLTLDPLSARQAAGWQRAVDYVYDLVDRQTEDGAASNPLVLSSVGRLLAAALLTAFDPDSQGSPVETGHTSRATVRRAVAYLETNPDLDLSVADIARGSNVSVRALQLAFRQVLDTTPMAYLRQVRLDRVRADLLAADPSAGDTVTSVATRWGFDNGSRFAAYYRDTYGVLPSTTLRDGR